MRNLAIIPARSGSKGLKNKNIKKLNGKPLLAYSIEAAKKSKLFDEIMVSTDSEKYAEIARYFGAKIPFLRSESNSRDKSGSWEVVLEVLSNYLEKGLKFDSVCLLQPTSPLRTANDIVEAYNTLKNKQADSVTSVCEVSHSPLWTMTLPESLSLEEFKKHDSDTPRQLLDKYYRLNGAIYIRKINYNNNTVNLIANNEFAYIMPRERSIDIDTELDFIIAETIMSKITLC